MSTAAPRQSQIREFLRTWTNTENKPHFAVLIDGRWGSGKTHFVTKLVEEKCFTRRRVIYLSTFGIPDIQSLETNLFYVGASTISKNLYKGAGFAGSVLAGSLTFGSGGVFGGSANLNKLVDSVMATLERSAKNVDGALLILDDLERCRIPMADLLGLINRFVEHGDTRIILVANTEDIKDPDFSAFREKIVGQSFMFSGDANQALEAFISEIRDETVRNILIREIPEIKRLYELSEYGNLRALRQYVWQLSGLIEIMDDRLRGSAKLVRSLVTQLFVFFTEFKLQLSRNGHRLEPKNLYGEKREQEDDARYIVVFRHDKDKEPSAKEKILLKYGLGYGLRTVVTIKLWVEILNNGVADPDRFNKELALSDEVAGVRSWPSWKRLWYLFDWDFSDGSEANFHDDVLDMRDRLANGSYLEPPEFLHVVSVCILLARHGLIDKSADEIVSTLCHYIREVLAPNLNFERYRSISRPFGRPLDAYDGLGYPGPNNEEFHKVRSFLIDQLEAWREAWLKNSAGAELLSLLPDDYPRFLGNLIISNRNNEQRFINIPILSTIDPNFFVERWLRLSRSDERVLPDYMSDRYQHHDDLLDEEGPWWRNVQTVLKARVLSSESRPRNVQLRQLIDRINSVIIDRWEVRQFTQFSKGESSDLRWMTRPRISSN